MNLNADFTRRIVLHGARMSWVDSPVSGVQRRMLERIGGEVARATSIVRYAPGSAFTPHTHGGGEEFIVLEGVFSDEHGDFPVGSYVRNPPTTRHTPRSAPGCVIFVKLWQFDLADRTPVMIDMNRFGGALDAAQRRVEVTTLFENARETVELHVWPPHAKSEEVVPDGAELLVLDGNLAESGDELQAMSWLRVPRGGLVRACAGAHGARAWVKKRHLRFVDAPAPR